ncbi:WxL domain-containing protein [Carnobacterium maltaromaticum]|uniref:WxL domain-containing protein n=1 Tax=Carnobacterium maltaromaticum TaxID=2751 RepID=UPI00295E6A25|nr:WxL domain-containing protein [Carnobacterium maltaromaticum]
MKKSLVLAVVITIGTIVLGGNQAHADVASTAKSDGKIKFTTGDGVITAPVDPVNPDNPNPPSPIDPTDPLNPGTEQKGPLSVDYVSNFKFGEHQITGKNIAYKALNKDPFVQVTDTRGAGDGWSLSAKMTTFESSTNKILKGATLAMKNSLVKAGSSTNISVAPVKSDVLFDNQESQLVLNAKDKAGRGTWVNVWSGTDQANEAVQLNVLAGTPEANTEYTASITWELEDAPK